ncbi:MAG TPA: hypothetical protein VMV23_09555 [Candidatus Nanopelagicaceae bacterium]|nr:hypothetical protein [Candidatus Nanopelagicaceae bacterium]
MRQPWELSSAPPRGRQSGTGGALAQAGDELRRRSSRLLGRSLQIRTIDTGSCGACESEVKLLASPHYDLHRLGLFFTPAPRHADCLLVTGPGTLAMDHALLATYEAMPDPKIVVAVGACPLGGVFGPDQYSHGGVVVPIDVVIPGCPPSPLALLHGLLVAVDRLAERLGPDLRTSGGPG